MKATVLKGILIVSMNNLDLTILASGIMRIAKYEKDKIVELKISERESEMVKYDQETKSLEISVSHHDLERVGAIEISNRSLPFQTPFKGVKIFMPDSTTENGDLSDEKLMCYLEAAA